MSETATIETEQKDTHKKFESLDDFREFVLSHEALANYLGSASQTTLLDFISVFSNVEEMFDCQATCVCFDYVDKGEYSSWEVTVTYSLEDGAVLKHMVLNSGWQSWTY